MNNKYIDLDLSETILNNINSGMYDNIVPTEVNEIPVIDGNSIIDRTGLKTWSCDLNDACNNLRKINPDLREELFGTVFGRVSDQGGCQILVLEAEDLRQIGIQLYPYVSYGMLNGGSATSYVDDKKNEALNPELMRLYRSLFEKSSRKAEGRPKGVTPAYKNPDGTDGPSFILLKLRALLIENLRYRVSISEKNELFRGDAAKKTGSALYPMFQMTSVHTDKQILEALEEYKEDLLIADLISETGVDITKTLTGIQPMIAALTHSSVGKPKQFFTNAWGRDGEMLPLPGGHGQNFIILSEIYKYLYRDLGKRFIYITNVDNIGNMPDPVSIAVTALSGCEASFEFSYKTPVDVKGGILVRDQRGKLNCADIGPAISREEVDRQEAGGKKILYNCATGLFNLEYITENIKEITTKLPMRITDQNKDAGLYSQAEQVTWEIIGMLEKPLILGVNKYDRYLAAKLLLESFMTSGLMINHDEYPEDEDPSQNLRLTAEQLFDGLKSNLRDAYGMRETDGGWQALSTDELKAFVKGE